MKVVPPTQIPETTSYFESAWNMLAPFCFYFSVLSCRTTVWTHDQFTCTQNKFPMRQSKGPIRLGQVPQDSPDQSCTRFRPRQSYKHRRRENKKTLHSPDVSIICFFWWHVEQIVFSPPSRDARLDRQAVLSAVFSHLWTMSCCLIKSYRNGAHLLEDDRRFLFNLPLLACQYPPGQIA